MKGVKTKILYVQEQYSSLMGDVVFRLDNNILVTVPAEEQLVDAEKTKTKAISITFYHETTKRQRQPLDAVQEGDYLQADDGFTCLDANATYKVQQRTSGRLYIQCKEGIHYLDGQTDFSGNLVGLTKVSRDD